MKIMHACPHDMDMAQVDNERYMSFPFLSGETSFCQGEIERWNVQQNIIILRTSETCAYKILSVIHFVEQ